MASGANGEAEAKRQRVLGLARRAGVLPLFERLDFWREALAAREQNAAFRTEHPNLPLPPLRWMHDMYGHARYAQYWRSGREHASAIEKALIGAVGTSRLRLAEWGCGMGRITRHLEGRHDVSGFDYNRAAARWCANNLHGRYAQNGLMPPLPADDGAFDAVFAVSVLTHLSAAGHEVWADELSRVIRPGGVLLLSVHGAPGSAQLLPDERAAFDAGELVVRGRVLEGSRLYVAYQPDRYMRHLLEGVGLSPDGPHDLGLGQVVWLAKKE